MMRLLYRPFGVLLGVLAGLVAGAIFKRLWGLAAEESESPKATDRDRGVTEIVAAAAVQGAVFGTVKALVDRAGASGFERVTGEWPGRTRTKTGSRS
jgi:hypothetical protein